MIFFSFSDNFLQNNYIIFEKKKSVDNFKIAHMKHAQFQFGVQFPLMMYIF